MELIEGKRRRPKKERRELESTMLVVAQALMFPNSSTSQCVEALDSFLSMDLDQLTLKKFPSVIGALAMLEKFDEKDFEIDRPVNETMELKEEQRQKIRLKATAVFEKFKKLFGFSNHEDFLKSYRVQLKSFQEAAKHLSSTEYYDLCDEPVPEEVEDFDKSNKWGLIRFLPTEDGFWFPL